MSATVEKSGNDLILAVGVEDDGEGWFECRACGLHVGLEGIDHARLRAGAHSTFDCADELEFS